MESESSLKVQLYTIVAKQGNQDRQYYQNDDQTLSRAHEERNLDQFLKTLKDEGIEVLVDVRKDAYSNRDKSFNEGNLSRTVANFLHSCSILF